MDDDRPSMDDDEFDYDRPAYPAPAAAIGGGKRAVTVQNQPHDEEVALSESSSYPDGPPSHRGVPSPSAASQLEASHDEYSPVTSPGTNPSRFAPGPPEALPASRADGSQAAPAAGSEAPGAYDPADYKHLNVSDDVRELFQLIGRYKPRTIELETRLKPFIPDFIPALGSIDEFIKVPRPDGRPDYLGLKVLDEPAAKQSDPTVLNLQLRQLSKAAPGVKMEVVGRIEHGEADRGKRIGAWVASIADIHKGRPAASVGYCNPMPDVEALMQEWPPEMEGMLRSMKMPTGDLELDLKTYVKVVCGLLDIPVYANPVESLHLLFSLFLEFKSNPFFRQHVDMADPMQLGGGGGFTPSSRGTSSRVGSAIGGARGGGSANVMAF